MIIKPLSWLEKVQLNKEPSGGLSSDSMLLNERYSFQFAYKFDEVCAMPCKIYIESEIKEQLEIYKVGNVPVLTATGVDCDDYYLSAESGVYPDVLYPLTEGKVYYTSPQRWESVWVTVCPSEALLPGTYEVAVKFTSEKDEPFGESKFTLTVLPDSLPEHDLILTNWVHYDSICEQHGVEPFTDEFYEIFANYLKENVSHGNNMLFTPIFTPALDTEYMLERKTVQLLDISLNDGKYSFDFGKLERFIAFCASMGVKYFEVTHLFSQWGAKYCPKVMATVDGEYKRIFGWDTLADGEEYLAFLSELLPKLVAFFKGKNVKAMFHISDEPKEEHVEHYAKLREFVKPLIADYPLIDALSSFEFYKRGIVDIPVVEVDFADKFIEEKADIWLYYCCGPNNKYFTNRYIVMPQLRTAILGAQLYLYGIKGFLHWGYNFYRSVLSREIIDPFAVTDALGAFPGGDAFIVYPDVKGKGVFGSIRHEAFGNGIQMYSLLMRAEEKYGRTYCLNLLSKFGISSLTEYTHNDEALLQLTNKLKLL